MLPVPKTYTVIDPLAVVVESLDTFIADVAMSRFSRANNLTCRAQHVRIKLFYQLQEPYFGRFNEVTWVLPARQNEEGVSSEEETQ